MRRVLLYLALGLVAFGQSDPQNVVTDWFPTHPGDKWIYDHETRDDNGGGIAHPAIESWRTEETIVGSWPVGEGILIVKQNRVVQSIPASAPAGLNPMLNQVSNQVTIAANGVPQRNSNSVPLSHRVAPMSAFLIRDSCIYLDVNWEPLSHQLTQEFREELLAGHLSPDFCFPFTVGETWGAPHWADWRAPADAKDWQVMELVQNTFHIKSISSYPGSGETVDIWFEKGVGIAQRLGVHHGTYGEYRTQLVGFIPAATR